MEAKGPAHMGTELGRLQPCHRSRARNVLKLTVWIQAGVQAGQAQEGTGSRSGLLEDIGNLLLP